MPHFAELNENNEVIYVIYMTDEQIIDENGNESEQKGIDHLHLHHGAHRRWVRTSYGGNFRGTYAGIGYTYREDLDMFIAPRPFSSWILDETTGVWSAPTPLPELTQEQINNNSFYDWSEDEYNLSGNGWILFQSTEE